MTIPQTTVPDDFGTMLSGQLAETGPYAFETRVSSTIEAVFGRVAFASDLDPEAWDEDDDTGNLNPIGIIVYTHQTPTTPSPAAGRDVLAKHPINIIKKGTIWVFTTLAVTNLNDNVVSFAPLTGIISTSGTALAGAKFKSIAGAAGIVKVELNLP